MSIEMYIKFIFHVMLVTKVSQKPLKTDVISL